MFLSRGDRDLGVAFQTHPGRQAFISSGSKELRSALESRRVSLGAHWVDSRESSLVRRLERGGPSSPAWPRDQSRRLSPNASGGLTPLSPPSELQELPVAIQEQSGVLCFHSRGMPSFPSQLEWKIGLAWANTRGILNSPS